MSWLTIKNGELLTLAANEFDVFVTVDRNLSFRQKLPAFSIAVLVLCASSNRLTDLQPLVSKLLASIRTAKTHSVTIETQHSAKADSALNNTVRRSCWVFASDKPITQASMVPLGVVMCDELGDRATQPQRCLADEDHAMKALVLDRAYEPLRIHSG